MEIVPEWLAELEAAAAGAVHHAGELTALSSSDELEVMRRLGAVRDAVSRPISLLASDIQRKSERSLGTEGLAQKRGFKDGLGLIQDLTGVDRGDAARLVRIGGIREAAEALAPHVPVAEVDLGGDQGNSPDGEERVVTRLVVPPERTVDALAELGGGWDAPIALALAYDWLTAAQADVLRRCLGSPRAVELAAEWRRAVLELIADTWTGRWSPEDLGRAAKKMRACLDGLAAQAEAAQRFEQRSFKRFVRESGMVHYDIELDPESDARVFGPIKRLLSPRFGGPRFTTEPDIKAADELVADPRTNEQLQVDTLVDLIDRGVRANENKLFKTLEPQVMVAITSDELRKAHETAAARVQHSAGDHSSCPAGGSAPVLDAAGKACTDGCLGPESGVAWIDGTDHPITALDAIRMICAGGFTPALFDETGKAIDIGQDRRYFTSKQRRAMAKRDGGCMYPGCDRPPSDCEAHHINPWAQGSANHKSEIRDGVLLCRRHHKLIHDHGAHIERRGSHYRLHWPGQQPRRLHAKSAVQLQLRWTA
jgi:hypothetical protein